MYQQQLEKRALLFKHLRRFMESAGFLEVDTAQLQQIAIPELEIELFSTVYRQKNPTTYFLIPSPEVGMKALLAEGCCRDIYQLGHCFRQEPEKTAWHLFEFCMLEWYRIGSYYFDNLDFTEQLVKKCGELFALNFSFKSLSMKELFHEILNVNLDDYFSKNGLFALCRHFNLQRSSESYKSREEIFHHLFFQLIEPELKAYSALFIYDYPAFIPTLSKTKEDNRYAERWELYLSGIELANCCNEENRKFWLDRYFEALHKGQPKKQLEEAQQYFGNLYTLLPDCSGVALGVDRLMKILS